MNRYNRDTQPPRPSTSSTRPASTTPNPPPNSANQTQPTRPSARRIPSGAWGRLRAPATDPLEIYGLPSKGETRLNDPKTQESYHKKIVERYMLFIASLGTSTALTAQFATLSTTPRLNLLPPPTATTAPPTPSIPSLTGTPVATPQQPNAELTLILSSMRKLRESLTATGRHDLFASTTLMFILQTTLLARDWSSYLPCLLRLLKFIHPRLPLPEVELRFVVSVYVLDLACRQKNIAGAMEVRKRYGFRIREVDQTIDALVRGDWVGYWRVREGVDGYLRAVMEGADDEVRVRALKCLGRAYLSADLGYVERCCGMEWEGLKKAGVGWELDGETVTIRRVKAK